MLKYALLAVALVFGLKFGVSYLGSEKFQQKADKSKAPWTCRLNVSMGKFAATMSHYDEALRWFTPVIKRCPKTALSEDASFQIAVCLEKLGRRSEAIAAYRKYAETYKGTPRARIALKSIDILSG